MINIQRFRSILVLVMLGSVFLSCRPTRELSYFNGENEEERIHKYKPEISKITSDDILAVTITSMDKETNEILNFANVNTLQMASFPGQTASSTTRNQPLGYLVDQTGSVDIPLIGKIKVSGLTLNEASTVVRELVDSNLVVNPAVNIRYLNHKFTVLGEVGRTGTFNLLDDYTTLPEALAIAGDIGVYGNRENVKIIRQKNNFQDIGTINMRTRELFESPYYYIQNGDLIYVEPLKEKATTTDQRVQLAPIVFSAVSTTLVVLTFIFNVFK